MSDQFNQYIDALGKVLEIESNLSHYNTEEFIKIFYPKQQQCILNPSNKDITMFWGGARGGKSFGCCGTVVYTDMDYRSDIHARIIVAAATEGKAKQLYWEKLKRAAHRLNLPWTFKSGESRINTKFNDIVFRGLKDIPNANKDQGFKIKLCLVEEPQTIKADILEHYIENVVMPRLIEVKGRVLFAGNPPHFPHPYLKKLYKNNEVNVIQTNMYDNQSLSNKKIIAYLEKQRKRLGFKKGEESAAFRREYYGEMIEDRDLVVFHPTEKNIFENLPKVDAAGKQIHWDKVMGIDIGADDSDAVVVIYYSPILNQIYVVEEYEKSGQNIKELSDKINHYSRMHGGIDLKIIDTGGLGKKITHDIASRYGTTLIAAEKSEKMSFVEMMKVEIDYGNMFFKEGSDLVKEMEQIIYTMDREKIDDKKGYHSDLLDACLYAFRYIYTHLKPAEPKDILSFEDNRFEELLERHRNKHKKRKERPP